MPIPWRPQSWQCPATWRSETISGVVQVALTDEHIRFLFDRLRKLDRQEIILFGINSAEHVISYLAQHEGPRWCGMLEGVPIAMWGVTVEPDAMWAYMVATDGVTNVPKTAHAITKVALQRWHAEYPHLPIRVNAWTKYALSMRWLRRLGFVPLGVNTGELIQMEHVMLDGRRCFCQREA